MSQATASKHVQLLERWIGARLLNRTTRRVSLTDVGATFHAHCVRILEDIEQASLAAQADAPLRGSLRLSAPVAFGSIVLGPLLAAFMGQNPDLALNVTLVDRAVDLIEEGYDLALQAIPDRLADMASAGMAVHRLMPMPFLVCAAPAYLAQAGIPDTPHDLTEHMCVTDNRHPGDIWHFSGPDGPVSVAVKGRLKTDNGLLRREVALAGTGVVLAPAILVEADIAAGRLVRLLPRYRAEAGALCAICPASRAALPKLRRLIGFLACLADTDRATA
jgi:DNA-binding transcriptional LysR family regulator